MEQNVNHFKEMLTKELLTLEAELKVVKTDEDRDRADETEVADDIEQLEADSAIQSKLQIRLDEVKIALEKIEKGTYGTCEISGEPIEQDRLEANPAATTCKTHMNG